MSLVTPFPLSFLSKEEWRELQALRRAISDNPASVASWKQEQFTSLFARSLMGKGDPSIH
jgi:hypothetical protein